ncbi:cache domain-containing protein [Candidatus Wolfebacteria bacterium]|nr:cache domain-containing protein [Candidatus Wolfebacteria bacterium]
MFLKFNWLKIIFCLALAIIISGMIGFGYYFQKKYFDEMKDELLNNFFAPSLELEAQIIANKLEARINNIIAILKTAAKYQNLQDISSVCRPDQSTTIDGLAVALKDEVDITVLIDKKGIVICASLEAMKGKNISSYPHIQEALASHKAVIGRAVVNPLGIKLIPIVVPIFSANGEFAGLVGGAIMIENLEKEFAPNNSLTPSAYSVLMDDDGTTLYHHNQNYIMKNVFGEEIQQVIGRDQNINNLWKRALQGESGYEFYTFKGDDKVAGFAPAKIIDGQRFLTIISTAKTKEYWLAADQVLMKIQLLNLVVMFGGILLACLVSYQLQCLRERERVKMSAKFTSAPNEH